MQARTRAHTAQKGGGGGGIPISDEVHPLRVGLLLMFASD